MSALFLPRAAAQGLLLAVAFLNLGTQTVGLTGEPPEVFPVYVMILRHRQHTQKRFQEACLTWQARTPSHRNFGLQDCLVSSRKLVARFSAVDITAKQIEQRTSSWGAPAKRVSVCRRAGESPRTTSAKTLIPAD